MSVGSPYAMGRVKGRTAAWCLTACGPLRIFVALEKPLAPRRVPGQRAGRPHRAACSRAQMPLWHTIGLARPPWSGRVTLQHARILPASRCSHPTRPLGGALRDAGKSGPRHPETQKPSVAAGGTRRGRFVGRRGGESRTQTVQWTVCAWRAAGPLAQRGLQGQRQGRRAQRAASTFSSHLSERSAFRARSELCDAPLPRQRTLRQGSQLREALVMPEPTPQGSLRVQRQTAPP